MPFTQQQMSAIRIAIEKAKANNPKNQSNPIVNNLTDGGNFLNSGTGLNNPNNYATLNEEQTDPKSNGTSVVTEPNLGTPTGGTPTDVASTGGTPTGGTSTGGISTGGISTGGTPTGGSTTNNTSNTGATISKKSNYILYGGILVAVIIVYKVFSKKTSTT